MKFLYACAVLQFGVDSTTGEYILFSQSEYPIAVNGQGRCY